MIELLGLVYTIGKDILQKQQWKEDEMLVDGEWLEKSGFGAQAIANGLELYWSRPDRIASREIDGWAVLYAEDRSAGIRYKVVRKDGTTLIGR